MSNNNLKRVAVITGSSRGIGKAIAKEFAKNNYSILLNARDENKLIEAVQEIRNEVNGPNQVSYLAGDISDEKICISLMEEGQITIEELQIKLVLQKNPEESLENSL